LIADSVTMSECPVWLFQWAEVGELWIFKIIMTDNFSNSATEIKTFIRMCENYCN
jgi:hypothetical protein